MQAPVQVIVRTSVAPAPGRTDRGAIGGPTRANPGLVGPVPRTADVGAAVGADVGAARAAPDPDRTRRAP